MRKRKLALAGAIVVGELAAAAIAVGVAYGLQISTAAFSGFPAALADVAKIERASGPELCGIAQRLGVDPEDFALRCHLNRPLT